MKTWPGLLEERYNAGPLTDPVDVYAMLVDAFYGEAGDKQTEQARAAADARAAASSADIAAAPGAEPAPAVPAAPAAAPEEVKAEEKAPLAEFQPAEGVGEEITEDLLKQAYGDDKDEVLDEIKKKKSDEKLPFPDEDLDDDDL